MNDVSAPGTPADPVTGGPRLHLLIPLTVAVAFFMESLDSTIIATALPQIAHSLQASPLRLSLAITSYLLSLAIFMPISGWVADRFGARNIFCLAIAIFTLGSAICGISTDVATMVGSRVLQGLGGAMMTPVGRLIMLRSFRKDELVAAMSYMAVPALLGPAFGPLVGGFFTTYVTWRWIFYINLPIGLFGILLAWRFIENFHAAERTQFDVRGFVLVAFGLAAFQLGIEYLGRGMVPLPAEIALLLSAVGFLLVYRRHARTHASPVLDLRLFQIRSFRISILGGSLCRAGIGAVPFLLPLLFQIGFGFTAMKSGVLTFVAGIGAAVMRGAMPVLLRSLGFRRMILGNGLLMSAMIAGVALLGPTTPTWLTMAYLLVFGFLRGTQFSTITTLGYADLTPRTMSPGASIMSIAQRFSMSIGVAVAAALVALIGGSERTLLAWDFQLVFLIVALLPLASLANFLQLRPLDGASVSGHRKDTLPDATRDSPRASTTAP